MIIEKYVDADSLVEDEEDSEQAEMEKHIYTCLGIQYTAYDEFKWLAVTGLSEFGNTFHRALGLALAAADYRDSCKMIRVWQHEIEQAVQLMKIKHATEKANDS